MSTRPSPSRTLRRTALFALLATGACASRPAGPAAAPASPAAPAPDLARDVRGLAEADFAARMEAAARLVARGEGALDALGAAGEQRVAGPGGVPVSTTVPVVRAILAAAPYERVLEEVDSRWPVVRAAAVEDVGRRGSWGAVPRLIDRLEDPEESVRAAAHGSLRRLTNRSHGYHASAGVRERAAAVGRWRAWWNLEGRARAAADGGRRPS